MYSYEERLNAVKLYIKCDMNAVNTVREFGAINR